MPKAPARLDFVLLSRSRAARISCSPATLCVKLQSTDGSAKGQCRGRASNLSIFRSRLCLPSRWSVEVSGVGSTESRAAALEGCSTLSAELCYERFVSEGAFIRAGKARSAGVWSQPVGYRRRSIDTTGAFEGWFERQLEHLRCTGFRVFSSNKVGAGTPTTGNTLRSC